MADVILASCFVFFCFTFIVVFAVGPLETLKVCSLVLNTQITFEGIHMRKKKCHRKKKKDLKNVYKICFLGKLHNYSDTHFLLKVLKVERKYLNIKEVFNVLQPLHTHI